MHTQRKLLNRSWFIFLLSLVAYSVPVMSNTFAAEVQEYIHSAKEHLERLQFKAAVIELKNALQKESDNGEARFLLGTTYLKLGDGASAEKELRHARDLGFPRQELLKPLGEAFLMQAHPQDVLTEIQIEDDDPTILQVQILTVRGEAYLATQQIAEAEASFAEALKLAPDSMNALLGSAHLALFHEEHDLALESTERVLANDPYNIEAWTLKGEVHRRDLKPQQAADAFAKVLEHDPNRYSARLGRAAALISLGKYQAAEEDLEFLTRITPKAPQVNYLRAVVAFQGKDYETSLNALRSVLLIIPDHLPSHLLSGAVYYAQGLLESAEDHLTRYLSQVSGHLPATKLLAAVRLKRKEPTGAIQILEPFAEDTSDPQLFALLGNAYLQKRDFARGAQFLQKAADLAPDLASIRTQLALGHLASGEAEQAISQLETAVNMDEDLIQGDMLLVLAYLRQQDFDKALTAAQQLADKLPDNPIPHNLIGAAYLGKEDRAAARKHLLQALTVDPGFNTAQLNLARLDIQGGNYEEARRRYQQVIKDYPGHLEAMLGMAQLAEHAGVSGEALDWLERAISANPGALQPGLLLTRHYLMTGEPLKALSLAREVAQHHPQHPQAIQSLGTTQLVAGQHTNAVRSFIKLTTQQPGSPNVHVLLGQVYASQGDFAQARKNFNRALELQGDYLPALAALAGTEIKDKNPQAALKIARQIQHLTMDSSLGFQLEGNAHEQIGDHQQAAKAYQQAYQRSPNNRLALHIYETRQRIGDTDGAFAILQDWLQHSPGDANVRLVLAREYQLRGRSLEAIREYEQVRKSQPGNAQVWHSLAQLYHEQGDFRSLEHAQKAHELDPKQPEIADTFGWILLHQGQHQRGLALLQDAAVRAPHLPRIRYHLAVALHKGGQADQARKELERLLRSSAEFSEAHDAKVLLERIK